MRYAGRHVATWLVAVSAVASTTISGSVYAHSASDAYLTLEVDRSAAPGTLTLHGQWDIALRDLDFVLKLDADGDGRVTWGELRRQRSVIERYAYRYLKVDAGDGAACAIKPGRQLVDDHADGAYAVLLFDAVCTPSPRTLKLRYTLFFAIDPSHRGIFVMHNGSNVATALLSPDNATVELGAL